MKRKFNFLLILFLLIVFANFFCYAEDIKDLPECELLYNRFEKTDFIISITPERPTEKDEVVINIETPYYYGEDEMENLPPDNFIFLYSIDNNKNFEELKGDFKFKEMKCRHEYTSTKFLFFKKRKTKMRTYYTKIHTFKIPPQNKGTKVNFLIKGDSPYFFLSEIIPVKNLWESRDAWENIVLLPKIYGKSECEWLKEMKEECLKLREIYKDLAIDEAQFGFDGEYLYIRIKVLDKINPGKCDDQNNPQMNAYGAIIWAPEYKPIEEGHKYLIDGWVAVYSPCINKIYGGGDVAFYESSTFKKGPLKDLKIEYKFFDDNEIIIRFPYENIFPNPSKRVYVGVITGFSKSLKEPIAFGNFDIISGLHNLLNEYIFSLQSHSYYVE